MNAYQTRFPALVIVLGVGLAVSLLLLSGCGDQAPVTAAVPAQAPASASAPDPVAGNPYEPQPYVKIQHPEWTRNAVIYQINTRQFTVEGTFAAAQRELPRLKELGVDILWLMPIQEIGEKNRKGSLGSPYSIKDYYSVNPEFGDLDDFKRFLSAAHEQGMHVILDWVANHTAWDNNLVTEHPEWYARDWKGDYHPTPWWDWSDIIELDYGQAGLREYMTKAMKYWVEEVGVDGFRCDVAGFVPLDFWNQVRRELDAVKPVFMLAEWESRDVHAEAFDASYGWSWSVTMHQIAMGKGDLSGLFIYYSHDQKAFPADAMRMMIISNHDKNSWEGTQFEQFGDALEAAIVLSVVGKGIPMIYNGQEAGNEKRLEFFEKDPIQWRPHPIGELYRHLFKLKKANPTLDNGAWGAEMIPVVNSAPMQVLSFVRENDADKIFAVINLSNQEQTVRLIEGPYPGSYTDHFSGSQLELADGDEVILPAWGYKVLVK